MPVEVTLRKKIAGAIRGGHPWIFRDALEIPPAIENGAIVQVRTREGRMLATGYWDARSPIAVRVLEAGRLVDVEGVIRRRLSAALKRRLDRLDLTRTNAFRWVHGEADRLPGIHIDVYDDTAVVRFDGAGARAFYGTLTAHLTPAAISIRRVMDRASSPGQDIVVRENGLEFEVALGVGGKGGLFLDQRENRERVERIARGRSVLNLFGYTGGFALYAARGGARSTDTVDTSRPAIEVARRNFVRNRLSLDATGFHVGDAFAFLTAAIERRRQWDVVISDPPSFAPSQRAVERARRAYTRLNQLATAVTSRGGVLCSASCSSHVGRDMFLDTVRAGARAAGRGIELQEVRGGGFDHPVLAAFPEGDYLKFAILRVF